ncbi:MAG: hypothetical protein QM754_14770 [Tepidisphaeraceae bacterium]
MPHSGQSAAWSDFWSGCIGQLNIIAIGWMVAGGVCACDGIAGPTALGLAGCSAE